MSAVQLISPVTLSDDSEVILDYLSPEHALNDVTSINRSSDIYVLGIIFYEFLLGESPYKYNDTLEFTHAKLTQKLPSVSDKNTILHILIYFHPTKWKY